MDSISHIIPFLLYTKPDTYSVLLSLVLILVIPNSNYIFNYLRKLRLHSRNKIFIEGQRVKNDFRSQYTDLFSMRFKAIWDYIHRHDFKNVYSIKEYTTFDYVYDKEADDTSLKESNIFVVNQMDLFNITDDIQCFVDFYKDTNKNENDKNTTDIDTICIELSSKKLTIKELENFVDSITKEYQNRLNNYRKHKKFIYLLFNKTISDSHKKNWKEFEFLSKRTFSNLFFNDKNKLLRKIDYFNTNKSVYEKNGTPWTFGLALSGPPGTGKTSIIKSIANYLDRHLIIIPLNKVNSLEELYEYFFESTYTNLNKHSSIQFENKIIVLEDIDCMTKIVKKRKESDSESSSEYDSDIDIKRLSKKKHSKFLKEITEDKNALTLSDLLNIIDGINETPGRILIITSNHYDKLDPALVRPGRIDHHINLTNATHNTINDIHEYYYNETILEDKLSKIEEYKYSPAHLINLIHSSFNSQDFLSKLTT